MPAKSNKPMRAEAVHSPAVNLKKDFIVFLVKNLRIKKRWTNLVETFQETSLLILCVALFADGGVVTVAAVVFIIGLDERQIGVDDVAEQFDEMAFEKL